MKNPYKNLYTFWQDHYERQEEMKRAWDEFFRALDVENMKKLGEAMKIEDDLKEKGAVSGGLECVCDPVILEHQREPLPIQRVLSADPHKTPNRWWRFKARIRKWIRESTRHAFDRF